MYHYYVDDQVRQFERQQREQLAESERMAAQINERHMGLWLLALAIITRLQPLVANAPLFKKA
jgi:hypothetical protein